MMWWADPSVPPAATDARPLFVSYNEGEITGISLLSMAGD